MEAGLSVQAVKQLGKELLVSKTHINNAPTLLSLLSKALDSPASSDDECVLHALLHLQAFFSPLLSSGELSLQAFEKAQRTLETKAGEHAHQAQAVYLAWLWNKYNQFVDLLLRIVVSPTMSSSTQIVAMDALMGFVREEKQGDFSGRLYNKLFSTLVLSKHFKSQMIEHLVANYFKYMDVSCHTCVSLRKVITCHGPNHQGVSTSLEDGSMVEETSLQSLMSNVSDILICINVPKITGKDSENAVIESWSTTKEKAVDVKSKQADTKYAIKQVKFTQKVKKLKSKISRVWLTFLQLPLTTVVYEKVLGHMHKAIIPNLTNPLLLSDFLTNSYNKGGLISVMALSGLFSLITEYGLEYPEFYNKLYALLEPSMFIAKYRARFFELLDLSLKSPLIPSYLAAAFAKKLGRMALKSPPAGALIVITIVHNLLRRHPSINCLVHQNYEISEPQPPDLGETGLDNKNLAAANGEETQNKQFTSEGLGQDPFNVVEPDPAKSNALKSSLWEMDTLRHHYSPVVSRFVASLEADLTLRAKTTELNVKDFSSGSYATIFAEEVKRRMKSVPLSFYKSVPTMLFPKALDSESPGLIDFPGWSFSRRHKQDSNDAKQSTGKNDSTDESKCWMWCKGEPPPMVDERSVHASV
ncbi:hypothetical protein GOP47_0023736 [Adiantum capillus-veneris]|uniref:CCAAT-binding factor domain-containing protein n=1 Tax=Adiantum capillus-veneris TaxID=13818 RepID=A0A9D4U6L3_ADICA|nr:hypothetical protein GOP47_0023736 [Adiantum capillus-veneris]